MVNLNSRSVISNKLNLGCGNRHLEGFINVDWSNETNPDMVWNLEKVPWPWKDNSIEEVELIHILEHLGATTKRFFVIIKELYRITCPGAKIRIAVPHPRCDEFLGDPTHVRAITPESLGLFSRKINDLTRTNNWPGSGLAYQIGVDFEVENIVYVLTPGWAKRLTDANGKINVQEMQVALKTYNNVSNEIQMLWVRK